MFPIQSSIGAQGSVGCRSILSPSKGTLTASVSVFPIIPQYNAATPSDLRYVFNHELGHNLGISHSATNDYSTVPLGPLSVLGTYAEYGDQFSIMERQRPLRGATQGLFGGG